MLSEYPYMRRTAVFWMVSMAVLGGMILTACLSLANAVGPSYGKGKTSYDAGRYDYAVKHFSQAVKEDPNHAESRFYLGLAYAKMKQNDKAKAQFQAVVEMETMKKFDPGSVPPNQDLISKAQKNVAVMTKLQIKGATGNAQKASAIIDQHAGKKDNYLTYAIPQGQVIHWDVQKMPVNVYFKPGHQVQGWKSVYNNAIIQAMNEWQRASNQVVRFKVVKEEAEADIVVRWQKEFSHNRIGVNAFQTVQGTIARSDVYMATYNPSGQPLTYEEIQGTALHELGHALGIQGHSPYSDDMMFFSQNPTQGQQLSLRDQKTIQLLYAQKADITNKTEVSTTQTKTMYELLQKANNYLVQDPQKALSYANQAYRIDPNNDNAQEIRNQAYYNLGVHHLNQGVASAKQNQPTQARTDFQQAIRIFETLSRTPNPPEGTQQNLVAARNNLSLVSK